MPGSKFNWPAVTFNGPADGWAGRIIDHHRRSSKIGDFPGATSVYDLSSFDLISMVKQFNEGLSYSGQSLGQRANFKIAAAFNPNVKYLDKAVQRMEKKIACGAQSF